MPKDYPSFVIDRSRRSEAARFSDDFIVCTDREVGFIARAYAVPKQRREAFAAQVEAYNQAKSLPKFYAATIGDSLIALEVERYLYEPVAHVNRIKPLIKKALRAYLYGEVAAVNREGKPYDDQIAAVDDVIRLAKSQQERISGYESFISALEAAKGSIELLQKIVKNGE